VQQRTPFGTFASTRPCETCGGRGKVIKEPCFTCKGRGKVKRNKKVEVKIPAGIDSGQTISIRGQGDSGARGGSSGDLLVTIGIRPHPIFERQGPDVIFDLPITVVQAALGAELEVPTLDGRVKYAVPAGTQNGTVFRLKGKGIPYLQSKGRGDEFVKVIVEIPQNLSERQKELLREFENTGGGTNEKSKKFAEKLKGFFNSNAAKYGSNKNPNDKKSRN
jgi:molecular chaperone DnaJ